MKKLFILLSFLFCALLINAQDKSFTNTFTNVATSEDTLTAADSPEYIIQVQSPFVGELIQAVTVTKVSGYLKWSAVRYFSYDNVTYTALDTVSYSTGGITAQKKFNNIDNDYLYYKIVVDGIDSTQAGIVKFHNILRK